MKLPNLAPESAWAGCWIEPSDVELLIPNLAHQYHKRFRTQYFGDGDDLEQSARLALWCWLKEKGFPERVRELEAFAVISTAIRGEIEACKRCGPLCVPSQSVNWKALAVPDRTMTAGQKDILLRFWMNCAKLARKPNYEALWLVRVCEWEPIEVSLYWRRKKDQRRWVSPDKVMKMVATAEKRIVKGLDPDLVTELLLLDFAWWGNGQDVL